MYIHCAHPAFKQSRALNDTYRLPFKVVIQWHQQSGTEPPTNTSDISSAFCTVGEIRGASYIFSYVNALETMTHCFHTLIHTWPAQGGAKKHHRNKKLDFFFFQGQTRGAHQKQAWLWKLWLRCGADEDCISFSIFALISMTAFSRSVTRGQTSSYQLSPFPQHIKRELMIPHNVLWNSFLSLLSCDTLNIKDAACLPDQMMQGVSIPCSSH